MKYDFDTVINRYNTGSVKYDSRRECGMPDDVLPMWVADMDFRAPEEILDRMHELVDSGVFGYTMITDEYFSSVKNWFHQRFGWDVQRQWLVTTPGIVYALATAVKAFTEPGDGVLIQRPVYYPFSDVIRNNDRVIVNSSLVYENGRYTIDFEDLEEKLSEENTALMLICSPHNPVGRVWTVEELEKVGNLCLKYGVKMVSDEIHCDFVYGDMKHHPLASISEDIMNNCVVCTAPSKTFNLAGLQASNIFIADRKMRHDFKKEMAKTGLSSINMMGKCACQAAYELGGPWIDELKGYIKSNIDCLNEYIAKRMPLIKVVKTEGTYLVWLDLNSLPFGKAAKESDGCSDSQSADQKNFIVNNAGLWLDEGSMFGEEGKGFERINVACPRKTLQEALERLEKAYNQLMEE